MSEIKVDKISPQSGVALEGGDAGDTVTCSGTPVGFGGGKVLQVVQDTLTAPWTTTSTTYVEVGGSGNLSVSITPAATSKVLILGTVTGAVTAVSFGTVGIKRDSTLIHVGDASGSRQQGLQSLQVDQAGITKQTSVVYLDTHGADGSTAVVYSWQVQVVSGQTAWINTANTDPDAAYYGRYASSIVAIEIGA